VCERICANMYDIFISIGFIMLAIGGFMVFIVLLLSFKIRSKRLIKVTWYKEPQIISSIASSVFFIEGIYAFLIVKKAISLSTLSFVPIFVLPLCGIALSIVGLVLQLHKPSRT
jgi:hypothetical protein